MRAASVLVALASLSLAFSGCAQKESRAAPEPPAPRAPTVPTLGLITFFPDRPISTRYTCDAALPDDRPPVGSTYWYDYYYWLAYNFFWGRIGVDEPTWPPFVVTDAAPEGRSVAGYLRDKTADDFVHWIFWDLPPAQAHVYPPDDEDFFASSPGRTPTQAGGTEGVNGAGGHGYEPICPVGITPHEYVFTAYVLDDNLSLPASSGYAEFSAALAERTILQETSVKATYRRGAPLLPNGTAPAPLGLRPLLEGVAGSGDGAGGLASGPGPAAA